MRFKLILIAIVGLLFLGVVLKAQADTSKFTTSHLTAAKQLVATTGMSDVRFTLMRNNTINILSVNIPEKYRDKFVVQVRDFFNKYLPPNGFKENMARLYAEAFTENELKQLTDFYNSPLGKKVTATLPELMQKGITLDQQVIASHNAELQSVIQEIVKE